MNTELLAPAGSLEKLKFAAEYGADAVYFGMEFGSLRNFAKNFSFDDASKAIEYLHERNKKAYVTLNIYPFPGEYDQLIDYAKQLDKIDADALIVADLGLINILSKLGLKAKIHVSTQANTTSGQTALAYKKFGAQRVNLARELSFEQIKTAADQCRGQIELEVFIHGAVCFSYSGRCAISDYMTGHRANRGSCKHPCRYQYSIVEEKRPNQYYPAAEDSRGLYLFNCKDLALYNWIEKLKNIPIDSLKIEGRMKSIHYIASTVALYRQLLDGRKLNSQTIQMLLDRVANRGYTDGFIKGCFQQDDYSTGNSISNADSVFVGNILQQEHMGQSVVEVRNNISANDQLEVLCPDGSLKNITTPSILRTTDNKKLSTVTNSQFLVLEDKLKPFSILRRIKD